MFGVCADRQDCMYKCEQAGELEAETVLLRRESASLGRRLAMGAAGVLAVVGTAAATTMVTLRVALPRPGDVSAAQGLDEMLAIKPAYESCATGSDDCLGPRCCAASGYYCFKNSKGRGQCMKECTPGGMNGTCEGVAPHMRTVVEAPGVSLFCFSVYTADTGSEKPSHELELLQMQHENAWNV